MIELNEQEIEEINGGSSKERDNLDGAAQLIGGAIGGVVGFFAAMF